jgi:acyl carrier protein
VTTRQPLTRDEFRQVLAGLLEVGLDQVRPEAHLVTDLGVDSLRAIQLLLLLEEMGLAVPLEKAWQVQTVADLYGFYREQLPDKKESS